MPRGGVTIGVIAVAAHVSVPTVSTVLDGRADVLATSRRTLERRLDEHGYERRGRTTRAIRLIDLVISSLKTQWAGRASGRRPRPL